MHISSSSSSPKTLLLLLVSSLLTPISTHPTPTTPETRTCHASVVKYVSPTCMSSYMDCMNSAEATVNTLQMAKCSMGLSMCQIAFFSSNTTSTNTTAATSSTNSSSSSTPTTTTTRRSLPLFHIPAPEKRNTEKRSPWPASQIASSCASSSTCIHTYDTCLGQAGDSQSAVGACSMDLNDCDVVGAVATTAASAA